MFEKLKKLFVKDSVTVTLADLAREVESGNIIPAGNWAAKNISTVYSCIRLLSDSVAALPLKLYTIDADGHRSVAKANPLHWVLSTAPCPWMDSFGYWKFNITCLLMRGFFVSFVIRGENGKITRLVPVNPDAVDISGISRSPFGELLFPINGKTYRASELFFAFYETAEDGLRPLSPMAYARETLRLAKDAENFGDKSLRNVQPGYYSTSQTLNAEAVSRVRDQLAEGSAMERGRMLLPYGIEYKTIGLSAADLQMLETRRYQKEEICGMFGVPPHLIGDTTQAKGWSTMEQTMTEFLQLSLAPLIIRIEKAITTRLIPERSWGDSYAKFSVDGLLRADTTARTNYYKTMNLIGVLSANEIREKEDLNPVEGGDVFYVQRNMMPTDEEEL